MAILIFLFEAQVCFALPRPFEKIKRGLTNIITAPLEIGKQVSEEWQGTDAKILGFFGGLMKGIAYTLKRLGSGVVDVISFPAKLNENYDPVMKPSYISDKD